MWLLPLLSHRSFFARDLFADLPFTNPQYLPEKVVSGVPRLNGTYPHKVGSGSLGGQMTSSCMVITIDFALGAVLLIT